MPAQSATNLSCVSGERGRGGAHRRRRGGSGGGCERRRQRSTPAARDALPSLALLQFVGLAAAAAIDIIPRLVKGANAAADTSTGAPSLDASTAGASVQASGRSIAVSALLAGGAVLAKYEQEHGIIQGG